MKNTLFRSRTNKVAAGICGAYADKFNLNAFLIRFIVFCACAFFWVPLFVYLFAWMTFPIEPLSVTNEGEQK